MKKISIKTFAPVALITLVVMSAGCAKIDQFGSLNANPNGITTPVPSALLTNALSQVGSITHGTTAGVAYGPRTAVYAQYISENQYTETSLYQLPIVELGATYSGPLMDLQTIINYNSDPATAGVASGDGSNANQIAVARILKSYLFWVTTDRWGEIPYSEALQGAGNLTPKFDKQEDIYFGMIKELKEAVAQFDGGAAPKGDILYGNADGAITIARWKKFANSLRMLMAMRLTDRYPNAGEKAALAFAEAAVPGSYIATNADNAVIRYPGGSFKNPWFLAYEARDDYASSKTMGDVLSGLGDNRSSVFGTNNTMFPYGLTRDLAIAYGNSVGNAQSRVLHASKRTESSPVTIIPASLVLLASAEAKERGWIPGGTAGAETDYNAGVTASFDEWGVAIGGYLAGTANYVTGVGVPGSIGAGTAPYDNFRAADGNIQDASTVPTGVTPAEIQAAKLKRIALQYWLAAFPNGNEGWANQRRTGVPNLKTTRFKTGPFVLRYVYGNNSYGLNNANTLEAAARMGGDLQTSHVWWDKN